jgi:Na+-translocating ferredoxin:NAD+ oxidoreductase RnfG subunit
MRGFLVILLLSLGAPATLAHPGSTHSGGKVFLTVDEALRLTYPDCEFERQTVYLTDEQKQRAKELARVDITHGIARPYVVTKKGKLVGTAYFDTHKVRTKRQTVMIAVDARGKIRRVELLAFAEPEDYIPRGKWYGQFKGKKLDDGLNLKRDIKGVTGATMTARATMSAVRSSLAIHEVLFGKPAS